MKKNKVFNLRNIIIIFLSIISIVMICKYRQDIYNLMVMLKDGEAIKNYLNSYGKLGMVIFFFFQIVQVVIFFIPGEVIQAAGGYAFGTIWGTVISLAGIGVGSAILFAISKKYGKPLVDKCVSKHHSTKLEKILNTKNINLVVFLLYLIPGMPKDSIIFMCALSRINIKNFLIYSMIGRIPALFVSTYFGAQVAGGNKLMMIVTTIIVLIALTVGVIKKEFLLKKLSQI